MTVTATVLFCGAGGDSLGAEAVEGVQVVMAANHWQTAVDLHQVHFPHAAHDVADIHQSGHAARTEARTWGERQGALL